MKLGAQDLQDLQELLEKANKSGIEIVVCNLEDITIHLGYDHESSEHHIRGVAPRKDADTPPKGSWPGNLR